MTVTASTVIDNDEIGIHDGIDYDLAGFDVELRYEWGPWMRRNSGGVDLGYPRVNFLHPSHGLGSGGSDEDMPEMVGQVDAIVRQLPRVMRVAAKEWWIYNGCVSRRAVCRSMTDWHKREGKVKVVQPRDLDVWLNAVAFSVQFGLGKKNG